MTSLFTWATLVATASPSDAVQPTWYGLGIVCFALSGICILVSAGLKLFAENRAALGFRVSLLGLLLALVQFGFAWMVRHIDFQPEAGDGTPASPSLLKALLVPFLPLFLSSLLALAHGLSGREKVQSEKA